jgi:methionyl-tRNA formyltransferase
MTEPTRVIFMGTPDFAVPPLRALIDAPAYDVVGVVTQPDRPAGRGNQLHASPVKQAALAANLPLIQPEKLRAAGVFEQLQAWQPDLIVVAAFGQILRQNVLDLPKHGCINVHASLLPRWRGAAPIQAAIRAGDAESGITYMMMDVGLDTGAMLRSFAVPITREDTGGTLHDKMAALGGAHLIETLDAVLRGEITPTPQDEALQTYAPMLKKDDGAIHWNETAAAIERQVRAFDPWPGTFTTWNGQSLKIIGGEASDGDHGDAAPGEVVQLRDGGVGIGTGAGVFRLARVQVAGKGAVEADAFTRGHGAFIGSRLG